MDPWILVALIFIPLIFSIIALFMGKYGKVISSILQGIYLLLAIFSFYFINLNFITQQFYGIDFNLSMDYLSYPLILLTSIVFFIAIIYQDPKIESSYFSYLFFLEFALMGVFLTQNLFVFYIFWELVLIPAYFLIGRWGEKRKDYTALKFLIYTHVGSVLMLVSIFIAAYYYYTVHGVFNLDFSILNNLSYIPPNLIFFLMAGFFLAFFIKLPSFPFHTWAPDVYVESPTTSAMIFSGILSKMGAYGIFRIFVLFSGETSYETFYFLLSLGIISIVYSALAALAQKDLKRMVAYSSIGHMGFITLAVSMIFYPGSGLNAELALTGGMFMMFAHGIIVPILFGSVGSIERATGTRAIRDLGGLTKMMPNLAFIMLGGFLASLGLPGMAGFIAEFSVIVGVWYFIGFISLFVIFGVLVVASYHIWAIQRTLFGPYNDYLGPIHDMLPREIVPMLILLLLVVAIGIYPTPIFHMFQIYAHNLLAGGVTGV